MDWRADGAPKLPKQVKVVERYYHDHSLESSWGAISDGTIIRSSMEMDFLIFFLEHLRVKL
jgi:hypothetical protein